MEGRPADSRPDLKHKIYRFYTGDAMIINIDKNIYFYWWSDMGHLISVLSEPKLGSHHQQEVRPVSSQSLSLSFVTGSIHNFYGQHG